MEELMTVEGMIIKVLPGTMFHVELPNKHQVLAHISGQDAQTVHPPLRRRPREDGNDPLRPRQSPHRLPPDLMEERVSLVL